MTRRRGQDPDAEQWAEALSQIARSVRAGESMHGSVLTLSPWTSHPPLQRATTRLQAGSDLVTALEADPDQPVEGHAAVALAALRVCARHGGRVAHALDATAATLRMRAAADQERVVFASQARMSSKVLSLLPGAVALWTMSTDERACEVWFGGSFGLILLSVGLALNLVGWMWMRAIVGAS